METLLLDALDREKLVLSMGLCKNKETRAIQKGRIEGLELSLHILRQFIIK